MMLNNNYLIYIYIYMPDRLEEIKNKINKQQQKKHF